jgi:hypothetical protein
MHKIMIAHDGLEKICKSRQLKWQDTAAAATQTKRSVVNKKYCVEVETNYATDYDLRYHLLCFFLLFRENGYFLPQK